MESIVEPCQFNGKMYKSSELLPCSGLRFFNPYSFLTYSVVARYRWVDGFYSYSQKGKQWSVEKDGSIPCSLSIMFQGRPKAPHLIKCHIPSHPQESR